MGIFQRIFKIGQSEANALVDKLEDPIKVTEQGIRDLKKDLGKSLEALAEVKALAIRSRTDLSESKEKAKNYEQKAILILKKVQQGAIDPTEGDRLAGQALVKKEENLSHAAVVEKDYVKLSQNVASLESNVKQLKSTISKYENDLKTLKARSRVASATKKINKSISGIDSSNTVAVLERMKEKVAQEEAMAEAYGDIANKGKSIDDEIDSVIGNDSVGASDALEELKRKMNQNK